MPQVPHAPNPLKDAMGFAKTATIFYAPYVGAFSLLFYTQALRDNPAASWFAIAGDMTQFYAACLLAWEGFHMAKASAKLAECAEYDQCLHGLMSERVVLTPRESGLLLDLIGDRRRENAAVRVGAERYQSARRLLFASSFALFAIGTGLSLMEHAVK